MSTFFFLKDNLDAYENNYYAFLTISPYIGLAYIILCHVFELDRPKEYTLFGVAYSVSLTIICLFFVTMGLSYMTRMFAYPRSILLASSAFQIILLVPWHLYLNRNYLRSNIGKKSIIIGNERAEDIAYKLISSKSLSSNIKYICKPISQKLYEYIDACQVVFVAEDVAPTQKQDIIKYCLQKKKSVLFSPTYPDIFAFHSRFSQVDDTPVFKVKSMSISSVNLFVKRGVDIILSCLALIVFAIPIGIISLILKCGGGSVFYKQERVTKDGKIFKIIKFRTMVENAEALSGPVLAQDVDPRITRLGHILRSTRMDEIPQILNIIKGDMSVVGPRPERPFFVEQFKTEIPEYDMRHSVKAGLTGFAQVHGKYNTTVRDKLKYDLMYINGYSLAEDIKLILQTLNILLKKSSTEGLKNYADIEQQIDSLRIE